MLGQLFNAFSGLLNNTVTQEVVAAESLLLNTLANVISAPSPLPAPVVDAAGDLLARHSGKMNETALEEAFEVTCQRWITGREKYQKDYDLSEKLLKLKTFPKAMAYQFANSLEKTNPLAVKLKMGLLAKEHTKAILLEKHSEMKRLSARTA